MPAIAEPALQCQAFDIIEGALRVGAGENWPNVGRNLTQLPAGFERRVSASLKESSHGNLPQWQQTFPQGAANRVVKYASVELAGRN